MIIQENIPLAQYTTFKIGGPARFFCAVTSEADLLEAVKFAMEKGMPMLVIGSGSNVLVGDTGYSGLVIRMEIKGITYTASITDTFPPRAINHSAPLRLSPGSVGSELANDLSQDFSVINVAAGEIMDKFIENIVSQGLYGLENLSAIPGTVGASPVQNISAYGQEVGNVIQVVKALDTKTMEFALLSQKECVFAYRDSIFKHEKGRYIITAVTYNLSKNGKVDISYPDLRRFFETKNIEESGAKRVIKSVENITKPIEPTLRQVRDAVMEIRSKKLPDWTKWGTAGSFFKNPIISESEWQELAKKYPEMPHWAESDGKVKISLGWILDKLCDAKGLVMGNVGTYENQALVIVSKPGATASEVVALAQRLMKCVKDRTGIQIESEVEWAC